jgi:phosphomevalonate kinase
MRIEASAPGKLVLLGEYAVLEGAPALVLAVNRRARVTLTPADATWEIVSPTLALRACLRIRRAAVEWLGTPPAELAWIATLFEQVPFAHELAPCRVELDSAPFHFELAAKRVKLGLGSSAALTVALLGALHAHANLPPPALDKAIDAHRAIQHGHGSGIDIAASLHGGLSCFRLDANRAPHCDALQFPDGMHWRCVFSGKPASTAAMLSAIAAWRTCAPDEYARHLHELATMAARGADAVGRHDAATFLSSLLDYAQLLARFGEAGGADVASHAHREIGALAAECDVVYKSCGAGGGDVGIAFSKDVARLRAFTERVARAGFPVVELQTDEQGLQVNAADRGFEET